jgi:hypothetical protein
MEPPGHGRRSECIANDVRELTAKRERQPVG